MPAQPVHGRDFDVRQPYHQLILIWLDLPYHQLILIRPLTSVVILDLSSLQGSKSKIIAPFGVGPADTENGGPAAGRIGSDRVGSDTATYLR